MRSLAPLACNAEASLKLIPLDWWPAATPASASAAADPGEQLSAVVPRRLGPQPRTAVPRRRLRRTRRRPAGNVDNDARAVDWARILYVHEKEGDSDACPRCQGSGAPCTRSFARAMVASRAKAIAGARTRAGREGGSADAGIGGDAGA